MNTNLSEYDLSTKYVLKYVLNFLVNTGPDYNRCQCRRQVFESGGALRNYLDISFYIFTIQPYLDNPLMLIVLIKLYFIKDMIANHFEPSSPQPLDDSTYS